MDEGMLNRIQSDPNFKKLVHERSSFGWTLSIVILVIYYGYIALVAFAPDLIAWKLAGSITFGIVLGAAIIVISIVLTGLYVMRANAEYDDLTTAIIANAKGDKR